MEAQKSKSRRRKSLTPEEKENLSIRARRRFKAIVRLAYYHRFWLEDDEDAQLGDNVKKNVQLLTRKKGVKSLITLKDKSILSKPAEYRTEAEKFHLNRVIGGLKCFRRYPPNVKSQLAAMTYFVYVPPGRVIIRQNDPPYSLYFIVTGDVIVSQTSWDPLMNEFVTVDVGTMVAGNMFGEVSILHGIYRTATITTATHCELLCLRKEDFDLVLKDSVLADWDEIKKAMSLFTYFDEWDEVASRECCILARLREYEAEETILGDEIGLPTYAYFLVKGRCRVVEHLMMNVEMVNGQKRYSLCKEGGPDVSARSSEKLLEEKKKKVSIELTTTGMPTADLPELSPDIDEPVYEALAADDEAVAQAAGLRRKSSRLQSATPEQLQKAFEKIRRASEASRLAAYVPGKKVEKHFLQCAILQETALFGIGENLENRRIIAITPVVCLLIPKYWLFQRNKGNVWNKAAQYLNNHIPSKETLFQEFLAQRKWQRYRQNMANDIIKKHNVHTGNSIHNVPYYIRINGDLEFDYSKKKNNRQAV